MSACLFLYNVAERRPKTIFLSCGSSVVEHSLGKGEVESSILSRSTRISCSPSSLNFSSAVFLFTSIVIQLSSLKRYRHETERTMPDKSQILYIKRQFTGFFKRSLQFSNGFKKTFMVQNKAWNIEKCYRSETDAFCFKQNSRFSSRNTFYLLNGLLIKTQSIKII